MSGINKSLNKQYLINTHTFDVKVNLTKTTKITRIFRISRVVLHTLTGFVIAGLLLPMVNKRYRYKLIQWWCKGLLAAFNIKVVVSGHIPPSDLSHAMIIANHISWADIHVLNSVIPLRYIAKSDIRHWPIFGFFASRVNTLFVDRAKKQDALRIVDITTACLKAGDRLCLFPEGTTTDGSLVLPFKSSLIEAASRAETPIYPVAIHYPLPNGGANTAMAYAGSTTLKESMQQALAIKSPVVMIHFFAPISSKHQDRRALALVVHAMISKYLNSNAPLSRVRLADD